jgi:hypothetical protein
MQATATLIVVIVGMTYLHDAAAFCKPAGVAWLRTAGTAINSAAGLFHLLTAWSLMFVQQPAAGSTWRGSGHTAHAGTHTLPQSWVNRPTNGVLVTSSDQVLI